MVRDENTLAEVRSPGSPKAFGITMALVASGFMVLPLFAGRQPNMWLGALVIGLAAISWLRPALLAPANRIWLAFGQKLHKLTSLIILGAMFFLVVTPLALVLRAVGSDRLALKRAPASQSYWVERDPAGRKANFDRPF
ncbi:SxtJ family membrane protein [Blastomonas aquatica]|uniref:SxtJ n=1 Tax=Blastomonas aquatica TaxID=1510276 RepID=A0ABQ1IXW6_9SPHN|nr:SxtJ family membrane protein [Blastomonas aquatica]GGB55133.1 hypothetical protein GCM10010833_07280 [Blastomonas aquatica]